MHMYININRELCSTISIELTKVRHKQSCQPETIDSLDIPPKFPGYLVFSLDT